MEPAKKTIDELQDQIVEDFQSIGDPLSQYEYLLEFAGTLPELPAEYKVDENLVEGCQSRVWLRMGAEGGCLSLAADSDTLIVRGILSLMVSLLDGRTACEIGAANIAFIEKTDLKAAFSDDRLNGFTSICATIKTLSKTIANQ